MGLGCTRSEWDDFEWFSRRAGRDGDPFDVWVDDTSVRVLLCDLDNLRADPLRLAARMGVAVEIARTADVAAFAGQAVTVRRCGESLAEFGDDAMSVGSGRNAADHALLEAADGVAGRELQFVVMSNDGVFARLAVRGALTVVSPQAAAVSSRLVKAARHVVDVSELVRSGNVARVVA